MGYTYTRGPWGTRGLLRGQHAPPKVSGGGPDPELGEDRTALVLFILSPCAHSGCSPNSGRVMNFSYFFKLIN